jgi:hypothetical protein
MYYLLSPGMEASRIRTGTLCSENQSSINLWTFYNWVEGGTYVEEYAHPGSNRDKLFGKQLVYH